MKARLSMRLRRDTRIRIVACTVVVIAALLFTREPWKPPHLHAFADTRSLAGVPNAANVLSSLAFVIVGLSGVRRCWSGIAVDLPGFVVRAEALVWLLFFGAVTVTGAGSAFYHADPSDDSIFWDRLPLSLALAAFIAAALTERVGVREGLLTLPVLLVFALLSVLFWSRTDDLRYYVALQAVAIVIVPLLCALLVGPYTRARDWYAAVGLYVLAKIAEWGDHTLYSAGQVISGHTLKHLLAGAAVFVLVRMLRLRTRDSTAIDIRPDA